MVLSPPFAYYESRLNVGAPSTPGAACRNRQGSEVAGGPGSPRPLHAGCLPGSVSTQARSKLTTVVDIQRRVINDPPLIVPVEQLFTQLQSHEIYEQLGELLVDTVAPCKRQYLPQQFRLTRVAHKFVGVGRASIRSMSLSGTSRAEWVHPGDRAGANHTGCRTNSPHHRHTGCGRGRRLHPHLGRNRRPRRPPPAAVQPGRVALSGDSIRQHCGAKRPPTDTS